MTRKCIQSRGNSNSVFQKLFQLLIIIILFISIFNDLILKWLPNISIFKIKLKYSNLLLHKLIYYNLLILSLFVDF